MTPELFDAALSWEHYEASMQANRELLRRKCHEFTLPEAERVRWASSAIAYVLVFTEMSTRTPTCFRGWMNRATMRDKDSGNSVSPL